MGKEEILRQWRTLETELPLVPTPIPYGHKGRTFDHDGIRITGSKQFIDSVLSRLKDMLQFESSDTRLQLSYQPSSDIDTGDPLGSHQCYIQVHQRSTRKR